MGEKADVRCGCGRPNCLSTLPDDVLAKLAQEAEDLAVAISRLVNEADHPDVKLSGILKAFIHEMAVQDFNATNVATYALVGIAHAANTDLLTLIARVAQHALERTR